MCHTKRTLLHRVVVHMLRLPGDQTLRPPIIEAVPMKAAGSVASDSTSQDVVPERCVMPFMTFYTSDRINGEQRLSFCF